MSRHTPAGAPSAPTTTKREAMKSIFLDCNDQLGPIFQRVHRADDPPIAVNMEPYDRALIPQLLDGYAIALVDHSYLPTDVVAQCKSLKHVVFLGTGAASYMNVAELAGLGVTVHTIKGYGDTAVAEHAIALMWAACRDIARMDRDVRAGVWETREGVQLLGKTLGVIGMGGIGREVARIGQGMGMQVIGWNRSQLADAPVKMVSIDELLTQSDVVSVNLVLNDETRHFLDARRLAMLKPSCIFVNTARGALVDESALVAALQRGAILHAGLDVFDEEPLKPGHPLTKLDNVTLSAHSAFRTQEASENLLRRAIDIAKTITSAA
jgi:D-3-phosphoglycerate dehydrogenase